MNIDSLRNSIQGNISVPTDAAYENYQQSYFLTSVAAKSPALVVSPATTEDIAAAISWAREAGMGVAVRGGGHGAFSSADNKLVLDLSLHFNKAKLHEQQIVAGGGTTMGTLLAAGASTNRAVPVGAAAGPGMGLALHGGIGWLCRRYGLTIDHVIEVEMVLPSGAVVALGPDAAESDLWWAVRGAAPNFGVVSRATFRTHEVALMGFHRYTVPAKFLAPVLNHAEDVGEHMDVSLACAQSPGEDASLLIYISVQGSEAEVSASHKTADDFVAGITDSIIASDHSLAPYRDSPEFDFPGAPIPEPGPVQLYGNSPFLGPSADLDHVAEVILAAMSRAQFPVRVNFEQMGGAIGSIAPDATPFWNRQATWSVSVTAVWPELASKQQTADWVNETVGELGPAVCGSYIVEAHPKEANVREYVAASFGENLDRLRSLKRKIDPENLFDSYYPLT